MKGRGKLRFLVVGDIVGRCGIEVLRKTISEIVKQNSIDFIIVNGENSANGKGLRIKEYNEIKELGADVITMGNHIYYRKEMAEEYSKIPDLLIPANITNLKGNGNVVIEKNGKNVAVINLIGRVSMGEINSEFMTNPFEEAIKQIEQVNEKDADYIFVDFHAEATAEKIAMGYFLQDRVTCVFGTHTHVQTADEKILSTGMAYITDVGMTGPKDSVLGLKKEIAIKRFVTGEYAKYECAEDEGMLNAIIVETDDNTKKAAKITRVNIHS